MVMFQHPQGYYRRVSYDLRRTKKRSDELLLCEVFFYLLRPAEAKVLPPAYLTFNGSLLITLTSYGVH